MSFKNLDYVIRLQRSGQIRRPYWRIVIQKKLYGISRAPLAIIGYYNCYYGVSRFRDDLQLKFKIGKIFVINFELLEKWLIKGARPTARVEKLLF